uniref:Putative acyl-coa synthetase n=1 Tax=Lutzomyia longipalpis TaxID=7200 RepID=A0A1B0CQ59_LUTLO
MTESGTISTESSQSLKGSVGNLTAGCTAKITDDDGRLLGFGESGEICVQTKSQFLGYYGDPESTKEILDEDGWIHTGDLGYFDEDGLLFVTGRKKDILKYNNFHVTPSEIEEILETHPGVSQAVVVGIPDPVFTDLPAALVICKQGKQVSEEQLTEMIEKTLPDYKKLRGGIYFVDNLPMTASGKIQKFRAKDIAIGLFKQRTIRHKFPPAQAAQLMNCPLFEKDTLAGLNNYTCGGSMVTKELSNKMKQYLPKGALTIVYGMTESGTISTESSQSSKGSVGNLTAGCTAKITDDDGRLLGVGESGEICVQTKSQFLGYYGDPESTKETLDEDGWIHTGDLGYFDEDSLLFVTGRKKDILKYNNFHVTPSEIEEILETHPGVSQAVVVGIPDPVFTDLPAALVICKQGKYVSEEQLTEMIEKTLPDYKKLRGGIYFVDNLPMTASGKIQKFRAKDLAIGLFKQRTIRHKL